MRIVGSLGIRVLVGVTNGLIVGFADGTTDGMTFAFSIFLAPGCLGRGRLDLPGSVGIDIPNLIIMPLFAVTSAEIIMRLQ